MIISFGCKDTVKLWNRERVKSIPVNIQKRAIDKLERLNLCSDPLEFRIPPSNNLEKLKGDLKGFYSIRVNNQYRIIFKWNEVRKGAEKVCIIDYHK